ncbi:MAG: PhzF family phenazine biosynthesis isomerase [Dehalococcoidia bacterium]|nr:PhzF family phenazine biosynthesis isomerase [Dehalococcoidia bacterium]
MVGSTSGIAFKQVDVFTDRPFAGNPVAVVLDGSGIDDATMQRIAAWTNLSETTFVLPSERADYRLRIFTPAAELPFAGHPTVGSAHAVIEAGIAAPRDGSLTQECLAGVIPLRAGDDGRIAARVPTPKVAREGYEADAVASLLGAPLAEGPAPLAIDVGPVWLVAQAESPEALGEARPDLAGIDALSRAGGLAGVTAFALVAGGASGVRLTVRSFAPAHGIAEDPVCGSGNAAVGAYLGVTKLLSRTGAAYVASQGREVGRDGRVEVRVAGREVEIGGAAVTVIDGVIRIG